MDRQHELLLMVIPGVLVFAFIFNIYLEVAKL
ncbi:hypothetical protein VP489E541_P0047 [Vibrio phage 489E54-1]|nr:hypothetical protein VP489E541_P0047 [Vibrio phage 489E54-1]